MPVDNDTIRLLFERSACMVCGIFANLESEWDEKISKDSQVSIDAETKRRSVDVSPNGR
jgi:hypothetical protein